MKQMVAAGFVAVLLGGCAQLADVLGTTVYAPGGWVYGSSEQPIDAEMKENMPWQFGPSSPKTLAAHSEPIQIANVAGWGPVKARAEIFASFPQPLQDAPGRNRVVDACRDQALRAAQKYGQAQVEAASLGPEQRLPGGTYRGRVRLRVIYATPNFHEVREGDMECTTDERGRFVTAKAVYPT